MRKCERVVARFLMTEIEREKKMVVEKKKLSLSFVIKRWRLIKNFRAISFLSYFFLKTNRPAKFFFV